MGVKWCNPLNLIQVFEEGVGWDPQHLSVLAANHIPNSDFGAILKQRVCDIIVCF